MTSLQAVLARLPGLQVQDLERWIHNEWVRPGRDVGQYSFHEIDVARIRLIQELRDEMNVNEEAVPVVLSLLDQIYDMRRLMRDLSDALQRAAPDEVMEILADQLTRRAP